MQMKKHTSSSLPIDFRETYFFYDVGMCLTLKPNNIRLARLGHLRMVVKKCKMCKCMLLYRCIINVSLGRLTIKG